LTVDFLAAAARIITESSNQQAQFAHLEQRQQQQQAHHSTLYTGDEADDGEATQQAPVFTTPLRDVAIREGQRAHFECRIIPVSDPNLKVEWLHNGQPIKQGSRFHEGLDFGFVSLDIMYCYPEDEGQYTCRATNALGQAVISANLRVQVNQTIDQGTLHQAAMDQIHYLEKQHGRKAEDDGFVSQAPAFTAGMRDSSVQEGQSAHFEAKLVPVGDPELKVDWFKDGQPLEVHTKVIGVLYLNIHF